MRSNWLARWLTENYSPQCSLHCRRTFVRLRISAGFRVLHHAPWISYVRVLKFDWQTVLISIYWNWKPSARRLPQSKRRKTKWLSVSLWFPEVKLFSIDKRKNTKMTTNFGLTEFFTVSYLSFQTHILYKGKNSKWITLFATYWRSHCI